MKKITKHLLIISLLVVSCQTENITQMELKNEKVNAYSFLKGMYDDQYFFLCQLDDWGNILINLCYKIENEKPKTLEELYKLSHKATNEFNDLQEEFDENDSEIETVARECIAMDFEFISNSYGFDADVEELIATRDW